MTNDSSCGHATKLPAPCCLYYREAIYNCKCISLLRLQYSEGTTDSQNIVAVYIKILLHILSIPTWIPNTPMAQAVDTSLDPNQTAAKRGGVL